MIQRRKFTIIISVLLLVIINSATRTVNAGTCPNPVVEADKLYWFYMKDKAWSLWDHRDWLMSYYDLAESDWDGGWGVHKLDDAKPHKYALPKMMNSMDYLLYGLDDRLKLQSDWSTRNMGFSGEGNSVLSRSSDSIERFGHGSDGALSYSVMWAGNRHWVPGEVSPLRMTYRIHFTDKVSIPVQSSPAVLSRGPNNLDVFFRSDDELVYAKWSSVSNNPIEFPTRSNNWTLEFPTQMISRPLPINGQDRYFISTDPVVITRESDLLDVFAIDELTDHLIHYYWAPNGDWNAEDINQIAGGTRPFRGDPVVINRNGISMDILIPDDRGYLIRYYWSADAGWARQDLTQIVGSTYSIESVPVVLSRTPDTLDIFARGQTADLIHYYWSAANGWRAKNLTEILGAEPIDGKPAVITRSPDTLNVFARGYTWRALIHFYWSATTGWVTEDLTTKASLTIGQRIDGNPVARGNENRVDVFARNTSGHLIHYYWTPELNWISENANYTPSVSSTFDLVEYDPIIIVPRTENVLDVIGKKLNGFNHFTSAIGLTFNLNPWHTNAEYSKWAAGTKHQFDYQPQYSEEGGEFAAVASWFLFDHGVEMNCPSFDNNAYPAKRAAWMIHEATHMNYHLGHDELNGHDVDNWIDHGLRDPIGRLAGGVPAEGSNYVLNPTHTPYQLSVESLCDFAEMSRDDIPLEAFSGAGGAADYYMEHSIINTPGWKCGIPRPLY